MRFTATEIAAATGGRVVGDDVEIDGATQDTRAARPGALFVPIVAERDGHDFIPDAVAQGAPAYLTSRQPNPDIPATAIVVADTQRALTALGRAARARINGDVVGITGSVGKTTVKDMALGVVAVGAVSHGSPRNFNNEIGLPLTLIDAPDDVERLILEMGARGVGHIAQLCEVARPRIGVVTRVAMAHGEFFGTIDDIARGKGELVECLPAEGVAVLNAGDERVAAMATRTEARVLTFGVECGDVRASKVEVAHDLRLRMILETPWGEVEVEPAARGPHNAENAAAAAAIGLALGMDLADVAAGLAQAEMSPLRMALVTTPSGATVIDDSYNANPASMKAALDAMAHLPATRRIAVLGIMAELGAGSDDEHDSVAAWAADRGIELVAVGAPQYRAERHGGRSVADIDGALAAIGSLGPDDAVLAKGSRVSELDLLVARLQEG